MYVGLWWENKHNFEPIRYNGDLHQLIVAGTGGGKFTTAIAPFLIASDPESSIVVIDPKGEIAQAIGPVLQPAFASKQKVFLLDPWDEVGTGNTASLNFLDLITADNPNYVDDARALADAMVLSSGADNQHWDNAARNYLTAVLLFVALDPREASRRDLIRVREIVTLPFEMPKAYKGKKQETLAELLFGSMESELAGGAIKRGFRAILNREEREQSGIISSVERDTAWIDSPQMAKVLRGKSLDMREAALGGNKYFVVIPPDFFMTHRFWLRLCVTAFAKSFRRYRPNTARGGARRWRHIVIDEFANLGEMTFVLNDIAVSRGYDVKYTLAVQDFSQLARVYNQGWESFINNSFQRFFAVSDMFTAEYVSAMSGSATVETISDGVSENNGQSFADNVGNTWSKGSSAPTGPGPSSSTKGFTRTQGGTHTETFGDSRTTTFGKTERKLLTADEVRRFAPNSQLLFFRGLHAISSWRPAYWEAFVHLPKFTLNEVLETVGRRPRSDAERGKFLNWSAELITPDPYEAGQALPSTSPAVASQPAARAALRLDIIYRVLVGIGVLGAAWWAWSSWFAPAPPPRQINPIFPEIRPAPVAPPISGDTTPAPPVAPPISGPVAPPISGIPSASPSPVWQPARPVRPTLPNRTMFLAMGKGPSVRDAMIQLMRDQVNYCAVGEGASERAMMTHLAQWAREAGLTRETLMDMATIKQYQTKLDPYFARSASWTRRDRNEVFNILLDALHKNGYAFGVQTDAMIGHFYENGGCPFDTVSKADYQPPLYGTGATLAKLP
jgi:type IV secretion system protein VirD4